MSVRDKTQVLEEAELADGRYRRGEAKSVLDGIPLAIKDNIYVKGM